MRITDEELDVFMRADAAGREDEYLACNGVDTDDVLIGEDDIRASEEETKKKHSQ